MAKRRILTIATLCLVLAISLFGFSACTGKKNDSGSSATEPVNYGESGVYYTELNGTEYTLMLNGNTYAMTLGEVSGEYEYDGSNLTFKGTNAPTAKLEGSAMTVTYNGGTYRFLKKINYEVTYDTNGGTAIANTTVVNGKTLAKPADPEKAGYDFIGWYADQEYATPFSFGASPITSNTTLYARYAEKTGNGTEFTVSFNDGKGNAYPAQTTIGGKLYDLPAVQAADFAGWYVSDYQSGEKLTYKYEGQKLESNVTLFAVYGTASQPSVDANGVKWGSAGANVTYVLQIKGPSVNQEFTGISSTTYAYDFANKPAGEYEITLTARGNSTKAYYKNKALARVSAFDVEANLLRYNSVPNAERYFISVECGNEDHNHYAVNNGSSLYYNFDGCEMKEGGIKFVVTAEADGYVSSVSEAYYVNRTLAPVTGVYVNADDVVVWNKVEGADKYFVEITQGQTVYTEQVGENTGYSLKNYYGDLSIKVYAEKKGYNSSSSAATAYNKKTLATPSEIYVSGNTVTWYPVEGAAAYDVTLGGKTYRVNEATFDLSSATGLSNANEYTLTVQAIANDAANNSKQSDALKLIAEDKKDEISYANGYVVWQYAFGANFYEVKVNDATLVRVQDANKYPVALTKAGENTIYVRHNYGENYYTEWASIKVDAYTITFDVRGGEALSPMYKAVGDELILPETNMLGYMFADWYTVPGGAAVNGKAYNSETYDVASDTTLYAYYTPNEYVVEFDFVGGGTGATEATVTYMSNYTLPVPESNDPAMGFAGWYTDRYGDGIRYTNELGESLNPWRDFDGVTLYAKWVNAFEFLPVEGGAAYSVMGSTGMRNMTYVKIPASYNGKPVTIVDGAAFINSIRLTAIDIPNTVKLIEVDTAFSNCQLLESVNIYDAKAEYPDDDAVQDAEVGTYVSHDGVLYQPGESGGLEIKFFPRGKVGKYEIYDGTNVISANVFSNAKITEIVIPASVNKIQSNAFYYCSTLTTVTFADSTEGKDLEVDSRAFNYCQNLTTITFPKRLATFDNTIFRNCAALEAVNIEGDKGNYYSSLDGILLNKDGSEILYVPINFTPKADGVYEIPAGVNKIAGGEISTTEGDRKNGGAFAGCLNIKTLIIPGYVTEIGKNAFRNCYRITELIFEGNDKGAKLAIKEGAFYGCSRIEEVVLPDYLNEIGASAFYGCSRLKTVTINSKGDVDFATGSFISYNGNSYVETLNIGKDVGLIEITGIFGSRVATVNIDNNPNYKEIDGVIYNPAVTELMYYPLGKTGEFVIPDTVANIGAYVFQYKDNLTTINIPKTIVSIGSHAFESCENLETVTFEEGRTENLVIGDYAFENIAAEHMTLPEKTTEIGDGAFANSALFTIDIPSTVEKMGKYTNGTLTSMSVFDGCENLYSININANNANFYTDDAGVLYLKQNGEAKELIYAVKGAVPAGVNASTEVNVPNTVTKIWNNVFEDNNKITKVTFNTVDPITVGTYLFRRAGALKEVTLSEGFTAIPNYTFYECTSLESIDIPYTVLTIGSCAFMNCVSLASVNFTGTRDASHTLTIAEGGGSAAGGSYKYYQYYSGVFVGCIKLKKIELPEYTVAIGSSAFAVGDKVLDEYFAHPGEDPANLDLGLEEIKIPATVTSIGSLAFKGMVEADILARKGTNAGDTELGNVISGLRKVEIAEGSQLTTINSTVFAYSNLESITIPAKVTAIQSSAFAGTKNLTSVTFEEGSALTDIQANAFHSSGLTSISIPATIKSIGMRAFAFDHNLTNVTFELNASGNSALADVTGRSPAPAINTYAFEYTGLTSIEFPKSTTNYTLGANMFEGCEDLTTVKLPVSVTNLDNVFAGNKSVEEILLAEGHSAQIATFAEDDYAYTVVYNSAKTEMKMVLGKLPANFTIPEGVTQIGVRAFDGHNELKELTIPKEVTHIGQYAFNACENLEAVTFEGAKVGGDNAAMLNSLDMYAFYGCKKLKSVDLPNSLTKISAHAFEKCSALSSVSLGNSVNSIMGYAFAETGITSITLPATLTSLGIFGVGDIGGKTPDLSKEQGHNFYNCTKLKTVTFEGPVTMIGYYAFAGCTSLTQFNIPASVTNIASHAFDGTGLTSIEIPATAILGSDNSAASGNGNVFVGGASTANVNVGVFANCENLTEVTFKGTVATLPGYLFYNCPSLTEIKFENEGETVVNAFPNYVDYVGNYAFAGTGLKTFEFKNVPNFLGGAIFSGAKDLTDVILKGNMTLHDGAHSSGWSDGKAGMNLSNFGNSYMFEDCESLVNVGYYSETGEFVNNALPETVEEIPSGLFKNCKSLVNLKLPTDVVVIGDEAFSGCINWVAEDGVFTLPAGVTKLRPYILEDCDSITTVVLHSKVDDFLVQMGNVYSPNWDFKVYGIKVFRGMDSLVDIIMPASLGYVIDYENGLLMRGGVVVWSFPALTKGIVEIPDEVIYVSALAFDGNTKVTGVIFSNVKYLGSYAFRNCENLDVSELDLEGITYVTAYYPTFMGNKESD